MHALGLGEVAVLVACQTAAHLHHLLAAFHVGLGRDALVGRHVLEGSARAHEVVDHRANLDRLVPLRLFQPLARQMLPEAEEPRHLRRRTEVLGIPQPRIEPVEADLAGHVPQRRPDLGEAAGRLGLLEQRGQLMRTSRQFGLATCGGVAIDGIPQPFASLRAVGARPHVFDPPLDRRAEGGQARVGGERFGDFVVVGGQSHVGPDPLVGAGPAVDLVAAVAAVLPDQVIPFHQLRRGWLGEAFAGLEVDDLVVALQAARFLEPLRQHREDPVVVVEPAVFVVPLVGLLRRVRGVRRPLEARGTPLPLVADRAAERLHRVRARRAHEQIEPRMGGVGLRHAALDRELERLAPRR